MRTLRLTFRNGSTRIIEAVSHCMGKTGVVIMTEGGRVVRISKEELLRVEESDKPVPASAQESSFSLPQGIAASAAA